MNLVEAHDLALPGWNLRCNLCGEHPAEWVRNGRPGWGSLALCPTHAAEYREEIDRHTREMSRLRTINHEQLYPGELNRLLRDKRAGEGE